MLAPACAQAGTARRPVCLDKFQMSLFTSCRTDRRHLSKSRLLVRSRRSGCQLRRTEPNHVAGRNGCRSVVSNFPTRDPIVACAGAIRVSRTVLATPHRSFVGAYGLGGAKRSHAFNHRRRIGRQRSWHQREVPTNRPVLRAK